MSLVNITPPNKEPVSVAEAKRYIKEDLADSDNDDDIAQAIQACRELCENDTRRALITQKWRLTLDYFPTYNRYPSEGYYGTQWGMAQGSILELGLGYPYGSRDILLPLPPLQSVDAVKYIDVDGTWQTFAEASYLADLSSVPGRVAPAYNVTWPGIRNTTGAVAIEFTCGYGDEPADVPACARQWIKASLGTVYEMRQSEFVETTRAVLLQPKTVDRLLDPIRYRRF